MWIIRKTSLIHDAAHLYRVFLECVYQVIQQLVGVVNPVGILSDDPYHSGLRFWLFQDIQLLAQCGDDALVFARITPEYIFDHNNRFGDHVGDLGLDEAKQSFYAIVGCWFYFDGQTAYRTHSLANKVHIDF